MPPRPSEGSLPDARPGPRRSDAASREPMRSVTPIPADSRSGATEDAARAVSKADAPATAPPPDTWVPEDAAADDDTLTPIEDPTLDHPIAPLATDEDDERAPVEDATDRPATAEGQVRAGCAGLVDMPDTPDRGKILRNARTPWGGPPPRPPRAAR